MTEHGDPGAADTTADRPRRRFPPWLVVLLQLLGLTGLAFAQPLFSLLGDNPTFFTAHGAGRADVIGLAVVVVLAPALVLAGLVFLLRAISASAGDVAMAVAAGLLLTLALVPALTLLDDAGPLVFLLALTAGTCAGGFLYRRFRGVRAFLTVLGAAPVVFLLLFLLSSPASALVLEGDPAPRSGDAGSGAPVVFVVFDELPLGALLDGRGNIDAGRFPGFDRLARTSTWYRGTTTVSPWTHMAVPAILTGTLPDPSKPPVAGRYERSLFTLLGGSYDLEVAEQITSLCPRRLCAGSERESSRGTLAKDTGIVLLHRLLPDRLAEDWLPAIGARWTDFGDGADLDIPEWQAAIAGQTFESDFGRFVGSLSGDRPATAWYHHEMNPHMPYRYLPDGTMYPGRISGSLGGEWVDWVAEPIAIVNARQRFLLQLKYADRQVGELLDALADRGLLRDALVVVVSDHGISFKAGGQTRGVTALDDRGERAPITAAGMAGGSADEVMPVPLFVKYPGQTEGVVDDRRAQTIDVLPTLAAALGITLDDDWALDGRSLLDEPRDDPPRNWVSGFTPPETYDFRVDPNRMALELRGLVGPGGGPHDLYAVGPAADLIGQKVEGRIGARGVGSVQPGEPGQLDDVEPAAPYQPVLFWAMVDGIETGTWLAVALNGVVAGLGPVFTDRDGKSTMEAMLDPSLMERGRNEVQVFLVDEDGTTLHPLRD